MITYPNLTQYLTEYSSTYCLLHYINYVGGANGSWGSSVIIVTRIQTGKRTYLLLDIKQGKGAFLFFLDSRSEQKLK